MTTVRWVTAFLDVSTGAFEDDAAFWCEITGSTLSERRGDRGQFATFVPPDGDAYFRIQARLTGTSSGRATCASSVFCSCCLAM